LAQPDLHRPFVAVQAERNVNRSIWSASTRCKKILAPVPRDRRRDAQPVSTPVPRQGRYAPYLAPALH